MESDYQASVLVSQSQIGSTTITGAEATIGVTITQFADLLSTSCIHASFGVPTFASAAAQTAWIRPDCCCAVTHNHGVV